MYLETIAGISQLDNNAVVRVLLLDNAVVKKRLSEVKKGDRVLIDKTVRRIHMNRLEPHMQQEQMYAHAHGMLYASREGVSVPRLRAGLIIGTYRHIVDDTELWRSRGTGNVKRRLRELMPLESTPEILEERIFAKEGHQDFRRHTYGVMKDFVFAVLEGETAVNFVKPSEYTVREWFGYARPDNPAYAMIVAPKHWETFRALVRINPEFGRFADSYENRNADVPLENLLETSYHTNYKVWASLHVRMGLALTGQEQESPPENELSKNATAIAGVVRVMERNLAMRISDRYSCIRVVSVSDKVPEGTELLDEGFVVTRETSENLPIREVKIDYISDYTIIGSILGNLMMEYAVRDSSLSVNFSPKDHYKLITMATSFFTENKKTRAFVEQVIRESYHGQNKSPAIGEDMIQQKTGVVYGIFQALESGAIEKSLGLEAGICIDLIKALETIVNAEPDAYRRFTDTSRRAIQYESERDNLQVSVSRKVRRATGRKIERAYQDIERANSELKTQYGYDAIADMPRTMLLRDALLSRSRHDFGSYLRICDLPGQQIALGLNTFEVIMFDPKVRSTVMIYPTDKVANVLSKFNLTKLGGYVGIPYFLHKNEIAA